MVKKFEELNLEELFNIWGEDRFPKAWSNKVYKCFLGNGHFKKYKSSSSVNNKNLFMAKTVRDEIISYLKKPSTKIKVLNKRKIYTVSKSKIVFDRISVPQSQLIELDVIEDSIIEVNWTTCKVLIQEDKFISKLVKKNKTGPKPETEEKLLALKYMQQSKQRVLTMGMVRNAVKAKIKTEPLSLPWYYKHCSKDLKARNKRFIQLQTV